MVEYKCNLCEKIFTKKSTFNDHQLRKRPCIYKKQINITKPINDQLVIPGESQVIPKNLDEKFGKNSILQSIINIINNKDDNKINNINKEEFKCKNCDMVFTLKTNLYRHMRKICNKKKEDTNNLILEKINEIINRQDKLEMVLVNQNDDTSDVSNKKIVVRKNNINNSNNTINTNSNNTNTINNNINICGIGAEDITKLSAKVLRSMYVCDNNELFLKSVEGINFNPDLPQNHNISYKNLRSNDCQVYDEAGDKNLDEIFNPHASSQDFNKNL